MRSTHTFVILDLSPSAFQEISNKLRAAGYDHTFMQEDGREVIDMHGIAVAAETEDEHAKHEEIVTREAVTRALEDSVYFYSGQCPVSASDNHCKIHCPYRHDFDNGNDSHCKCVE